MISCADAGSGSIAPHRLTGQVTGRLGRGGAAGRGPRRGTSAPRSSIFQTLMWQESSVWQAMARVLLPDGSWTAVVVTFEFVSYQSLVTGKLSGPANCPLTRRLMSRGSVSPSLARLFSYQMLRV